MLSRDGQFNIPIAVKFPTINLTFLFFQAQLDRLQNEIAFTAKRTGIASAAKLATLAPKKELVGSFH